LQSSPFSSTSGQLLCSPPPALYAACPPLSAASPRHLLLALASRVAQKLPTALYPSRCALPASPRRPEPPVAATSTPPWRARDRAHCSSLSRTEALHIPRKLILSSFLLFPHPRSPRTPPVPAIATSALSSPWTHCFSTTPPLPTSQLALPCSHEAHQPFLPANPSPERRLR